MDIKKDIETRDDIEALMRSFYNSVLQDDLLRPIFIDIAKMNLETHLPVIIDFWETILLDNPVYKKNAMQVHYDLNKKIQFLPEHFERWLAIFSNTLSGMYKGEIADLAWSRAKGIAEMMQYKMIKK